MLRERLQAHWISADLDRRLADGADPDTDRLLRLRAARLLTPAGRATAATGIESVVASVRKPVTPFSAAVPIRRGAVRGARRELMALAGDLRHVPAVHARGVALAGRLITDPESPLYTAASSDDIVRAVHEASYWLSARASRTA